MKQRIIQFNTKIGAGGQLLNPLSLDFATSELRKSKYDNMALQLRSLLVDHAFVDGNKRTAYFVVLQYMQIKNPDRMKLAIVRIAKNSVTDLNKIKKAILNANG